MTKTDWRRRPRKPAAARKAATLSIRLTRADALAIHARARAAGMTATDYIVRCCLAAERSIR